MAEIATIVRRGRASVLQSIHVGCTRNCLGVEAKAVKASVWTVLLLRRCVVAAANLGGRWRNVVSIAGSNVIPTLCFTLEPNAEAVLRGDV